MTCIVGYVENGTTWMGADSIGSDGQMNTIRKDSKIFKLKGNEKAIIGYTDSFRMGQILQHKPGLVNMKSEETLDYEFLVTKFIPNVTQALDRGGFGGRDESGSKSGGTFLLGFDGRLFRIDPDFQVGELYDNYNACGSGQDYAMGAFAAIESQSMSPQDRILTALRVASKFSPFVAPPYKILNTKTNEVLMFKE